MKKSGPDFFKGKSSLAISRELLGMHLVTSLGGQVTSGIIVETEAYLGKEDKACHAAGGRFTNRTKVMYGPEGTIYVYLIYGVHPMFNLVCQPKGEPHAILIRAIKPVKGLPAMLARRKKEKIATNLTAGPGSLAKALGITTAHSGLVIGQGPISLEDHGLSYSDEQVITSPRVNVDYAGEDAKLPYRFRVRDSKWCSPAK